MKYKTIYKFKNQIFNTIFIFVNIIAISASTNLNKKI